MATSKERDEFIAELTRALPDKPTHTVAQAARLLLRHARTHKYWAEAECNGPGRYTDRITDTKELRRVYDSHQEQCEKRQAQLEKRMAEICTDLGITANFGGDPRGYTVKVHLPTGANNTWGGVEEGYGVPQ